MTIKELDFIFPFVIFTYGALIAFVLSQPKLMEVARSRFPAQVYNQLRSHELLGWFCFIAGGLWSLQNIWLQ